MTEASTAVAALAIESRRGAWLRVDAPSAMGFLAVVAMLLPLLGPSFYSTVGIHPRLVSHACSAIVVLLWLHRRHRTPPLAPLAKWVLGFVALLVISVLASFDSSGPIFIITGNPTVAEYPGYKLTRFVINTVPLLATGMACAPSAMHPKFEKGVIFASYFVGALAGIQFAVSYGTFTDSRHGSAFFEGVDFSVISTSLILIHLHAALYARYGRRPTWLGLPMLVAVSGVLVFAYFIISQRTALLASVFFVAFMLHRSMPGRLSGMVLASLGIYIALSAFSYAIGGGALTGILQSYVHQFNRIEKFLGLADQGTTLRLQMLEFCLTRGVGRPLGHGVGSFPAHFLGFHYPHNIVAEALFEFGFVGFVAVVGLVVCSIQAMVQLFRGSGRHDFYLYCLGANLLYAMKAGDLTTSSRWLLWLFIAAGASSSRAPGATSASSARLTKRDLPDAGAPG